MPKAQQPNFDEDFEQAVVKWREQHQLRENDAVLLLVDLFRIHQRHWDELRRREMPSFAEFRADIARLTETTRTFQGQSAALLDVLKKQPATGLGSQISRAAALFASMASLLAGYLIGRVWP